VFVQERGELEVVAPGLAAGRGPQERDHVAARAVAADPWDGVVEDDSQDLIADRGHVGAPADEAQGVHSFGPEVAERADLDVTWELAVVVPVRGRGDAGEVELEGAVELAVKHIGEEVERDGELDVVAVVPGIAPEGDDAPDAAAAEAEVGAGAFEAAEFEGRGEGVAEEGLVPGLGAGRGHGGR